VIARGVSERKKFTARTKLVLEKLAWFANEDGVAWASDTRLAAVIGMSPRSVQYAKADLKELGLIIEVRRGGGPEGHRVSSTWRMGFPPRDDLPDAYLSDRRQTERARRKRRNHGRPNVRPDAAPVSHESPPIETPPDWLEIMDEGRELARTVAEPAPEVSKQNSRKDEQGSPQTLAQKQERKKRPDQRGLHNAGQRVREGEGEDFSFDAALCLTALQEPGPSVLPKKIGVAHVLKANVRSRSARAAQEMRHRDSDELWDDMLDALVEADAGSQDA
jgi:hypothetical protein